MERIKKYPIQAQLSFKSLLALVFVSLNVISYAQHKNIPLESYYKTRFLKSGNGNSIETFFPANEHQLCLSDSMRDTSTLYYDFHVWVYQKHWLEINKKEGNIHISPLVNFSYGKSFNKSDTMPLYRNTRGIYMEGEILDKLSFSFIFCENQSRFMEYESTFFRQAGEIYTVNGQYDVRNAVIPSGARTKPFKISAFDYAFSIGSFSYQMTKNLRWDFGNNQHFIGVGYRSLFLSDNTSASPYVRMNWKINEKWSYQLISRRQKNLYRKPDTDAIESVYENKLFTASYLSFKPIKSLSISLFSGGNQLRTDSISKYGIQAQMLVPLPLFNTDLIFSNKLINGISGLNLDFSKKNVRLYGQLAIDLFQQTYLTAYQAGFYLFDAFKITNLDLQFEYNKVCNSFYSNQDPKLAYSNNNLASAHPKGNNFDELILIAGYEYKRFYASNKSILYFSQGGTDAKQFELNSIFSSDKSALVFYKGTTFVENLEIGYRFNRRYNPTFYVQFNVRSSFYDVYRSNFTSLMAGLKVNLFNQYLDF